MPSNVAPLYVTAGGAAGRAISGAHVSFDFKLDATNLAGGPRRAAEWAPQDLVISARLDSDGTAATRDPEDLVGAASPEEFGAGAGTLERRRRRAAGPGLTGRILTAK